MLVIGERINASRDSIVRSLESRDLGFIQREAVSQDRAGADYIDVNAALFEDEEAKYLKWVIEGVQAVTDKPLCIDSPDPETIRSVMPIVRETPMINSITLDPNCLMHILPLVRERGAKVIGLCQSEALIAKTVDEKISLAGRLVDGVMAAGIPLENLYIDPLTFPAAADPSSAVATLDAIEAIMKMFPGVHTICGLTNVSYGLPARKLVSRTFLVAAATARLDAVILDPTDKQLFGALKASIMLSGGDDFCMEYIKAYRDGRLA